MEGARFTELELRLSRAIAEKDLAALRRLLADDFELRDAADPAELTLRDDWIEAVSRSSPAHACTPGAVMHRPFGATTVLSLLCRQGDARHFLVDVWRREGSEWRLAARYRAPAPPAADSHPPTKP